MGKSKSTTAIELTFDELAYLNHEMEIRLVHSRGGSEVDFDFLLILINKIRKALNLEV